jgi:uncharacterized integral membrane protein (TIGR00698 family)
MSHPATHDASHGFAYQSLPTQAAFQGARRAWRVIPGVLLCCLVACGGLALQELEVRGLGRAWLEALVLAIIVGVAVRTAWEPGARWSPGIAFSSKVLLEMAVMLMGVAIGAKAILAVGAALLAGIGALVIAAIGVSYGVGRAFGLPHRMAVLIACGNSICGNAAIAAVAPVIGADADEVAAAIAFTAVLGVGVVLGLPLLMAPLGLTAASYGVFAGLTVYAVPQVLAATAPAGVVAVHIGALVKLTRVMMLGPVCAALGLIDRRMAGDGAPGEARALPPIHHLVPWFIVGFLALAVTRSAGLMPNVLVRPAAMISGGLTVVSMAGLGLGVDLRVIAAAGGRVATVAVLSLVGLGFLSLALIHILGPGL